MNTTENGALNDKIIKNAISSYLMILINGAFFISKDENVHHPFVLGHTKKALSLHIGFVSVYIIFIHFGLFGNINYENIFLNKVIAGSLFIFIFLGLLHGLYRASKGISAKNIKVIEDIKINLSSPQNLVESKSEINEEKEKLTIILSLIPFISPFIYSKKNKNIQNTSKICVYFSFLIIALIVSGKTDMATFLSLIYLIFVAFSTVLLFVKSEIFVMSLGRIGFPFEIYKNGKYFFSYLKNYFGENFKNWSMFVKEKNEASEENNGKELETIQSLPTFTMNTSLIYIPLLQILTLKKIESSKKNQIINSLGFFIITIIIITVLYFSGNFSHVLFLLLPYIYILANKNEILYKSPFFYDVGYLVYKLFFKHDSLLNKAKDLHKKEEITQFKVQ